MRRIVVVYGGHSEEREVSLVSGRQIAEALKVSNEVALVDPKDFSSYTALIHKIKEIDPCIVFNGLHGAEGENGKLQALFDLEGIKYTGSGHLASGVAMDKNLTNKIAEMIGLSVPETVMISLDSKDYKLDFPMVVKPNDSGSSVGIHIVEKKDRLDLAIKDALKYSEFALVQKYVKGKEITVTILDNESLTPVEIAPKEGWYDYTSKYTKGKTEYIVPARLSEEETSRVQKMALEIFNELGCKSYARVDFRFDGKDFFFLEVNTLPGMTPLSLTPMAAKDCGYNFTELLEKIIETSIMK